MCKGILIPVINRNYPPLADQLIDCATTSFATNHSQVSEPIGSLCIIVGLAPRVTERGYTDTLYFHNTKLNGLKLTPRMHKHIFMIFRGRHWISSLP